VDFCGGCAEAGIPSCLGKAGAATAGIEVSAPVESDVANANVLESVSFVAILG
jgi:hypothetical protein